MVYLAELCCLPQFFHGCTDCDLDSWKMGVQKVQKVGGGADRAATCKQWKNTARKLNKM
jgi:hypothetical protein